MLSLIPSISESISKKSGTGLQTPLMPSVFTGVSPSNPDCSKASSNPFPFTSNPDFAINPILPCASTVSRIPSLSESISK